MIKLREAKRLFALARHVVAYSNDDHFHGEIASQNMWNAGAQFSVVECVPLKQHLVELQQAYDAGLQYSKLQFLQEYGLLDKSGGIT